MEDQQTQTERRVHCRRRSHEQQTKQKKRLTELAEKGEAQEEAPRRPPSKTPQKARDNRGATGRKRGKSRHGRRKSVTTLRARAPAKGGARVAGPRSRDAESCLPAGWRRGRR